MPDQAWTEACQAKGQRDNKNLGEDQGRISVGGTSSWMGGKRGVTRLSYEGGKANWVKCLKEGCSPQKAVSGKL